MFHVNENNLIIRPPNSSKLSSVQYCHIQHIEINLLSLLTVAPMLHTFEGGFWSSNSNLILTRIYPRVFYLHQLRIKLWTITWKNMTNLLLSFPQLIYLIVIAENVNSDMADGFAWARLLRHIKHFEFKLEFSYNAFEQEPLNLDSFRTKFWLEEKKWFVTYDRSTSSDDLSILYSNYFSMIVYPPHEIFGTLISETTAAEPGTFSHVNHLTIYNHYLKYRFVYRYKHIKELHLSKVTTAYSMSFKDFVTCIDTSQIMKCIIFSEWIGNSSSEHIEFLHNLPRLRWLEVSVFHLNHLFRYQWSHIIHLKIDNDREGKSYILSSNDIDSLCHSFPHIERLDIYSSHVTDLSQLLNRMKITLTDIIIRQSHNVNNQQLITRQWIERNTKLKNFHYKSRCDFIQLWL
ncbi:unnamed protein product [Rotaria sordida]|uniref:Uncharacterized protein n=1 Tax=Rotaria sordida TaxID=392033 RepID=A0A814CZ61_9BILA|nr:unnamed protein product [Rotaria sordida]CAF4052338.1 unnamed protein product [Rotaria sordida]